MKDFAKTYGYNINSQNGEDGILYECVRRISPLLKVAVEFGAPDLSYCSNTANLLTLGFRRYLYDSNPRDIMVEKKFITADNVNELPACSVLSIDIDGEDYNVWSAYNGTPDIVIIEINSSLDPSIDFFHPEKGANFSIMEKLGVRKGYFLLCHTGNMVFVLDRHRKLFPEINEVTSIELFNRSWLL